MSKKKKKPLACPCCRKRVGEKGIKKVLALFPYEGAVTVSGTTAIESFVLTTNTFNAEWACDACLESGKALIGQPKKQTYFRESTPYLAYRDRHFTCNQCEEDFLFSKEEQQHWYEKLQFVIYARPKQCLSCRKEIRRGKQLNTELSKLLEKGTPNDVEQLSRIAEIYEQMEKPDKVKFYLNAVKKQTRN